MVHPASSSATVSTSATRARYLDAAARWWALRQRDERVELRVAWGLAALTLLVAGVQFSALMALLPLAVPTPVAVEVARDGGGAQALQRLKAGPLSRSPVMLQGELARYVALREGVSPASFAVDYRHVVMASAGLARDSFVADWARPHGQRFASTTSETAIRVSVTGVVLTADDTAQIAFTTERRDGQGAWGGPVPRTASVRFAVSERPLAPRDRLVNPLGLTISDYRAS